MHQCTECGYDVKPNANYCAECGSENRINVSQSSESIGEVADDMEEADGDESGEDRYERHSFFTTMYWASGLVIGAAALLSLTYGNLGDWAVLTGSSILAFSSIRGRIGRKMSLSSKRSFRIMTAIFFWIITSVATLAIISAVGVEYAASTSPVVGGVVILLLAGVYVICCIATLGMWWYDVSKGGLEEVQ